jgi:hypothetical protein
MMKRSTAGRLTLLSVAALIAVSGCGSTQSVAPAGPAAGSSADPAADPAATSTPELTPTLPAGDPGSQAPEAPDPGAPTEPPEAHPARRAVPAEAMLDPDSVGQVLGGTWSMGRSRGGGRCAAPLPAGAAASRSVTLVSHTQTLTETLTTHPSGQAAVQAVKGLSTTMRSCGWTATEAPALGEQAVQAVRTTDGQRQTIVALAAEGVAVTLVVDRLRAADAQAWESIVDLALGSSCAAAADGCH